MDEELGVEAGQVIADTYRLDSLLGRGGMGSVWRAEHLKLMSPVAVKILKPKVSSNGNSVARFLREAKAAALLRSPHVVQILEHGRDGEIVFIAMELLEGQSLHQRLKQDGPLSPAVAATVLTHVGRAMQKAHDAQIVHRDLKPDNIFLVENDDELLGKVLDFGIAKSNVYALNTTGDSPQTQTGTLLGTPYYMSPEQATGQKDVDHRSDLWAIGVIAYECLIGRRPYQSDALGDLVLQICSRPQPVPSDRGVVPVGFDEWFAKTQERDPEDRFQSAREMTQELRRILTGRPTQPSLTTQHEVLPSTGTNPLGTPAMARESQGDRASSAAESRDAEEPVPASSVTEVIETPSDPGASSDAGLSAGGGLSSDGGLAPGETLDAITAEQRPNNRRLLGGAGLALALGVVAALLFFGGGDEPAPAGPTEPTGAAAEEAPEPPAEATTAPTASATVEATAAPTATATASASATASTKTPAPVPRRVVPRPVPRPTPKAKPTPKPKPKPIDPLAI